MFQHHIIPLCLCKHQLVKRKKLFNSGQGQALNANRNEALLRFFSSLKKKSAKVQMHKFLMITNSLMNCKKFMWVKWKIRMISESAILYAISKTEKQEERKIKMSIERLAKIEKSDITSIRNFLISCQAEILMKSKQETK